MERKTLLLLTFALLAPFAARAQTNPPTPPPSKASIEDDPQFKRLSPEQQELVRKAMQNIDKAVAAEGNASAAPKATPPNPAPALNAQPGCTTLPVKKPRFHLPKAVQTAINKHAKQIGGKTGVDLDPNAPGQAVNDAQKDAQGKPCPSPAPATPKPAAK